jgi:PHD/YefM family antitoxin component YafN of YafNO toxin-antitoxin module
MIVQTVKRGRERFVLLREKDYRQLMAKAARKDAPKRLRRLTAQDRGDIAEARRRRNDLARPYSELRKKLGLK